MHAWRISMFPWLLMIGIVIPLNGMEKNIAFIAFSKESDIPYLPPSVQFYNNELQLVRKTVLPWPSDSKSLEEILVCNSNDVYFSYQENNGSGSISNSEIVLDRGKGKELLIDVKGAGDSRPILDMVKPYPDYFYYLSKANTIKKHYLANGNELSKDKAFALDNKNTIINNYWIYNASKDSFLIHHARIPIPNSNWKETLVGPEVSGIFTWINGILSVQGFDYRLLAYDPATGATIGVQDENKYFYAKGPLDTNRIYFKLPRSSNWKPYKAFWLSPTRACIAVEKRCYSLLMTLSFLQDKYSSSFGYYEIRLDAQNATCVKEIKNSRTWRIYEMYPISEAAAVRIAL